MNVDHTLAILMQHALMESIVINVYVDHSGLVLHVPHSLALFVHHPPAKMVVFAKSLKTETAIHVHAHKGIQERIVRASSILAQ